MSSKKSVQFKIQMSKDERRSLRQAALNLGVSAAALVRNAIAPYLGGRVGAEGGRA